VSDKLNPLIPMLRWTLIFLVVALIAGLLGFVGAAGAAAGIALARRHARTAGGLGTLRDEFRRDVALVRESL